MDMTEEAKELLTRIARDTSLRYAMHMIMASALVCQKRKGTEVDVQDLKKVCGVGEGGALSSCGRRGGGRCPPHVPREPTPVCSTSARSVCVHAAAAELPFSLVCPHPLRCELPSHHPPMLAHFPCAWRAAWPQVYSLFVDVNRSTRFLMDYQDAFMYNEVCAVAFYCICFRGVVWGCCMAVRLVSRIRLGCPFPPLAFPSPFRLFPLMRLPVTAWMTESRWVVGCVCGGGEGATRLRWWCQPFGVFYECTVSKRPAPTTILKISTGLPA